MFCATALGVKPAFDDWVSVQRYDEFVDVCKDYGMHVEHGLVFVRSTKNKKDIVGGENITTTFAEGVIYDGSNKKGRIHVFVSRSKKNAINAKRFGWYSVVINNRTINKPFIDHLRFGKCLGFPDCCISFFNKYNNWKFYSHPYQTLIHTRGDFSYHCNNHLMDSTYFYIHHLPCSYNCTATIELSKKVENKIMEVEPEFVKKTNRLLKKPLLVFSEKNFVMFDGKLKGNELTYNDSWYHSNYAREEEKVAFISEIKKGNRIIHKEDMLHIYMDSNLIRRVNMNKGWFLIEFD